MRKTLSTKRHKALISLLVNARVKAGINQVNLADQLGEYQSFVARLESGQRRLDVVEFLRLCELLSIDPREALNDIIQVEDK